MAVDPPVDADRPNIVVFYIDDVDPHDGRLWNDPARTPNIVEHFYDNGFEFNNAIVENPLCCPARANFLTGLHTHNNGVVTNDARLFDPSVHLGKAMKNAGYASMFIGKYLNRNVFLTLDQWQEHDAGWTQLDVFKGVNGYFNDYTLHTKTGDLAFGKYHSTQMVADRAVMHLRETPANQPVFAVLSIYNLHAPNLPMPEFRGDPRCANMPPWKPANYNEADVSDKPLEIQALPLLPDAAGWPMVRYCEELLGIDKAVGQVTNELEALGRLDNTLLVFAGDNGVAWGAHRLGQEKLYPYTTPVPLFMSWPERWSNHADVDEHVSNIDLAPTFCELAQTCEMTDYPRGQTAPDGVSLVPYLDGEDPNLGRQAVLEASYGPFRNSWTALRTTHLYPGGLWHYVEYATGERELYNLATDPYELVSRANSPTNAPLVTDLAARLEALRNEGLIEQRASIRIVQSTVPANEQEFDYTSNLGSFSLHDLDFAIDEPRADQIMFANVPLGSYTFTQAQVAGWILTSIACTEEATVDVANGSLTIDLHANSFVVCTFNNASQQPDAAIATSALGPFKADGFYSPIAIDRQTVKRKHAQRRQTYEYLVMIQNDGGQIDSFKVRGVTTGSSRMKVAFVDPADVTTRVSAGTYTVANLAPAATAYLAVRVTVGARANIGATKTVNLTVSSLADPSHIDVVRAVTKR